MGLKSGAQSIPKDSNFLKFKTMNNSPKLLTSYSTVLKLPFDSEIVFSRYFKFQGSILKFKIELDLIDVMNWNKKYFILIYIHIRVYAVVKINKIK